MDFFIGTQSDAIVAATLDERRGQLTLTGPAATVARPTWVQRDPARAILFATSEVGNAGDREGEVLSFAIHGATLTPVGRTGSAGGGATHLELSAHGGTLFVANFGGGSVAAIPVAPDGALSEAASVQTTSGSGPHRRQAGPHPHGVTPSPDGRHLFVPDMGADRIFVYCFDPATRALTPAATPSVALPAGCGPRLLTFGRDDSYAYLLSELSAELFVFAWNAELGELTPTGSLSLDPPGGENRSAAVLLLSDDGRFLYASNRVTDTILAYALVQDDGSLHLVQTIASGGGKPWGAAISPDGRWLLVANQGSDAVAAFRRDPEQGTLIDAGSSITVATPTSIAFS